MAKNASEKTKTARKNRALRDARKALRRAEKRGNEYRQIIITRHIEQVEAGGYGRKMQAHPLRVEARMADAKAQAAADRGKAAAKAAKKAGAQAPDKS